MCIPHTPCYYGNVMEKLHKTVRETLREKGSLSAKMCKYCDCACVCVGVTQVDIITHLTGYLLHAHSHLAVFTDWLSACVPYKTLSTHKTFLCINSTQRLWPMRIVEGQFWYEIPGSHYLLVIFKSLSIMSKSASINLGMNKSSNHPLFDNGSKT